MSAYLMAQVRFPLSWSFNSPADMRKLDAALTRHGKAHEFHSYPGAGHAFMNRRCERYRADADRDSWPKTLAFFAKHLARTTAAAR